jgi:AraC-like DNA-binding protein
MSDLIAGTALLHFAPLVVSLGGDPDRLLRMQGIDPAAAGDGDRLISYTGVAAAIGTASTDLHCPDFGLRLSVKQGIDILGPVAVLIRNAETVSGAIEGVCRYLYRCAPPDVATLERGPHNAVFTYDIALRQFAHREQIIEKSLGVTLEAFRLMIGEDFVPLRVTMQHRRLSPPERYHEFFGCPVEFGSSVNGFHFAASQLDRPIRGRDAAALALAENYLAQSGPDLPLVDYVRETIHRLMKVEHAALIPVAKALAFHPRVLQRRLEELGTSFEAILDDVRRGMAWHLSATGLQVSQIATMLGYSEQSSYARACRRWHSQSPRQLISQRRSERVEAVSTAVKPNP